MVPNFQILKDVIEGKNFTLHQQHIWSITLDHILGTELLLRFDSDIKKNTNTAQWIKIAEDCDLLQALTFEILKKIVRHQDFLQKKHAPYFINISPPVLTLDFVKKIQCLFEEYNFNPARIGVEFTERQPILDICVFQKVHQILKTMGVKTALDDYGCGFSTMNFLTIVPVDCVKIDQSILYDARNDTQKNNFLMSLINCAHLYKAQIIAEGVETQNDYEFAKSLGCHGIQGFYKDHPNLFIPNCVDESQSPKRSIQI